MFNMSLNRTSNFTTKEMIRISVNNPFERLSTNSLTSFFFLPHSKRRLVGQSYNVTALPREPPFVLFHFK